MATPDDPSAPNQDPAHNTAARGPGAWLRSRAGLIILVVIFAVVALRLMSSWIKWTLIAIVGAAIYYLIKGALRRASDDSER